MALAHVLQSEPLYAPLPDGRFATIVADPPWDYSGKLSGGGTSGYSPVHPSRGGSRGAANHYRTLDIWQLKMLPVPSITAEQSHLYLWTTGAFMAEAFELAGEWGFRPKGVIPWVKTKRGAAEAVAASGDLAAGVRMGMGLYIRWCTEFVVFAVRGKLPTARNDALGIVFAERGRHSEKPEALYDLVRALSPGPRIDLFARREREGFVAWGDELAAGGSMG
jgi:N6-adenosine-specific RNA methylase IME4